MPRLTILSLTTVLFLTPVLADVSVDMQKCGEITDNALRLSCYDALNKADTTQTEEPATTQAAALPSPTVTTPTVAPVNPSTMATPTVVQQPATQTPAPRTVPAVSVAATPKTETQEDTGSNVADRIDPNDELFGFENQIFIDGRAQIESRYVGEFRGWSGKTLFRLENGQVWQQAEESRLVWRSNSPVITIKKAMFGSFRLKVDGVNKTVKVKRVK